MGFNNWNAFGCDVNEALIKETADAMVANGMKAAGYQYVNIDDCWMSRTRDADGNLQADPAKFPRGIKALADYVHSRGLKLGIYESAGLTTCEGYPGSYGHEAQDAQTFASWGIDYLKYDNCGAPPGTADNQQQYIARYKRMGDALKATGRDIVYSICEQGRSAPWIWAGDVGHLWRTTVDIRDIWPEVAAIFRSTVALAEHAGPGAWNDPDMLEVGNGGMSDTEYRSHFGLWAFMAAPLISGTDLRKASKATLEILTNRDLIAIDQDPLGKPARVLSHVGKQWILVKDLAGGDKAVLFFNEDMGPVTQSVSLRSLGIGGRGSYVVKDLWSHERSQVNDRLTAFVEGHGTAIYRVSRPRDIPSLKQSHVAATNSVTDTYVEPGKSTTITGNLVNDGTRSVNHVALTLSVPPRWKVKQVKGPRSSVPGGASTSASWELTVPPGASVKAYSVEVSGSYQVGGHRERMSSERPIVVPPAPPTATSWLSDLPRTSAVGKAYKDQQLIPKYTPGSGLSYEYKPITMRGVTYAKGVGTISGSSLIYYLGGRCSKLTAIVGVDDNAFSYGLPTPSLPIRIVVDGKTVFDQRVAQGSPVVIDEDLSTAKAVELEAELEMISNLSVDWANARVVCS
ncbi:NPCBM/NEW2 domain-containing protein [Nonomuraea angiospora]|uniref:NPCBM/NEW2 domain-containing protein n=1 Tax=Nonomuraea angiospora TaxID=46172 RepID=UPI0029AFE864|nr:NPCBM/NEW2 domain-containing protein [Nonomuraea angiospora]MDX3101897.1 NPCBM/NEW2 domain-containing protein [Nonomuraea angiospora]